MLSCPQLIEHSAERKDVGSTGGGLAAKYLRGHIQERAGQGSRDGSRGSFAIWFQTHRTGEPCQAKVQHFEDAVGAKDDVLRLDIAMQDAFGVRSGEGLGGL